MMTALYWSCGGAAGRCPVKRVAGWCLAGRAERQEQRLPPEVL